MLFGFFVFSLIYKFSTLSQVYLTFFLLYTWQMFCLLYVAKYDTKYVRSIAAILLMILGLNNIYLLSINQSTSTR